MVEEAQKKLRQKMQKVFFLENLISSTPTKKVKSAAAKIILGWDQFDILGLKVEIVDFF